jgi:hypothetical protein
MSKKLYVRRQWNDYRVGEVSLDAFDDPHWRSRSGGVRASSPRPFIHGYICCDGLTGGEIAHSCTHGTGPHWILVCVVKKDNDPETFELVRQMADKNSRSERPNR